MKYPDSMNSRIRITEDGNHLFHVERNYYTLSAKQSIWPWKPLRYDEKWQIIPCGYADSYGKAVRAAKDYIRGMKSKVILEAKFSDILDGTAFGDDASADDYDREGGAE